MLRYITCGESHNQYLNAILEGMPSGLKVDIESINEDLKRRQSGYGRGPRMKIETDRITLTSGILNEKTSGSPIGFMIMNDEVKLKELPQLKRPRPGHADLVGALKYDQGIREILERASARETAMRVAVGSLCRQFLSEFGIEIISHIPRIASAAVEKEGRTFAQIKKALKKSELQCVCPETEKKMKDVIKQASDAGDTLGGEIEVIVKGMPAGVGSFVHHERKLDALLAQGLISLQAIKAVQFGLGADYASTPGSNAHDEIFYTKRKGYYRKTNNAGGIEGGMSNGENIIVRATMKPIATLKKALRSVNMDTKKSMEANFERSDVCAVTACGVICETIVAEKLTSAFLEKFGGDSMREIKRNFEGYMEQISER